MTEKNTTKDGAAEVEISEEAKAAAQEASSEEAASEETLADGSGEEGEDLSLEAQLLDYKEQVAQKQDMYMRAVAEMENYRKRAARERQDLLKFGNENLLRDILPVIDNLERAVEHAKNEEKDNEGLLEGVEMTLVQFQQTLNKFGVTPIAAEGQTFDPACHEAMGQMVDGSVPVNTVVQVMQTGYHLNERLLRPAMVMIAKAPEAPAAEKPAEDNESDTDNDDNE